MTQDALFYESTNDALRAIVEHYPAPERRSQYKVVGHLLRPTKSPDVAGKWLNDCLNPLRQERLDPDDVLALLKIGREIGFHGAMNHLGSEANYRCEPVEPLDEQARLQRDFIEAVKALGKLGERLERPMTHMKMVGT